MREIIEVDPDGERKCPMCRFGFSTLYRFEDEDEGTAVCGDCFLESILEKDLNIADGDEIIIHEIVAELVDHALTELSVGELDELENTLRSIDDQLPQSNATPTSANA